MDEEWPEFDESRFPLRDDDPRRTPLAWPILWSIWGLIVAALIGWIDQSIGLALPWLVGGGLVGFFGWTPFLWLNIKSSQRLSMPLLDELVQEKFGYPSIRSDLDSDEEKRLIHRISFHAMLPALVYMSLLLGTFFGAVIGALCAVAEVVGQSATFGALSGFLLGPVVATLILCVTCAILMPLGEELSSAERWHRSWLFLAAPFLVVPLGCYCIWEKFWGK